MEAARPPRRGWTNATLAFGVYARRWREQLDALVIAGKGHWWTGRGYFRYLTAFHLWAYDGAFLFPLEQDPSLTLTGGAVAGRMQSAAGSLRFRRTRRLSCALSTA